MKNIEVQRFVIKKKPYQKIEDLELRKEKVSDEIYRTLLGLREVLPDIVWHQTARTKKKALERIVPIDPDHIRAIVDKKWDYQFPDVGCILVLWTGTDDGAGLVFNVGHSDYNDFLSNVLCLEFPYNEIVTEDDERIKSISKLIWGIWDVETEDFIYREEKEATTK